MKSRKDYGFTLAEVLITLGIIGVVAAMTIPTLIEKYKITTLHASFNKTYAVIQQALKITLDDIGFEKPSDVSIYYDTNNEKIEQNFGEINKIWETQFNGASKVKSSTFNFKRLFNDFWGAPSRISGDTHEYYYLLPDGSLISDIGYNKRYGGVVALDIFFDTNGLHKGPNRIGYDQFYFYNDGETTPYQGDVDYLVDCDPFRTKSPNGYWDKFTQAACSSYALKNINPYDSSKKYWDSLYKPQSWWKKLK